MLVDEHAERNAIGIEAVQEILDVGADEWVETKFFFILNHSLGHGGDHVIVSVSDLNEGLQEAEMQKRRDAMNHYSI